MLAAVARAIERVQAEPRGQGARSGLDRLAPGTPAYDAAWTADQLRYLPAQWRKRARDRHAGLFASAGEYAANCWLRALAGDMRQGAGLAMDAADAEIRTAAREAAASLYERAMNAPLPTLAGVRAAGEAVCIERGIVAPAPGLGDHGAIARMFDSEWWVRRLRAAHGRRIEAAAIGLELVHKNADCYVSTVNVARRREQKARNAKTLAGAELENQHGQVFTLAELAERSNANPRIKRAELMTRIAGFEACAVEAGHSAEFWTVTAPSRFHSVKHDGRPNPRYDGSTPREAQSHLVKAWAQCRAAMHRAGVRQYGFRIAEPHHDGCPHWHLLLWLAPEHIERARALVVEYFRTRHDGSEPGANKYRCKFVSIDPARGTAAGYVAKYVAKNIDGYGIERDLFGNSEIVTAERVDAWAATWGIRQFQQIGGAPVGVWRELRRLRAAGELTERAEDARAAADAGDWKRYTEIQGGALVERAQLPLRVAYTRAGEKFDPIAMEAVPAANKYGEPCAKSVYGVRDEVRGRAWLTRRMKWEAVSGERAGLGLAAQDARAAAVAKAGRLGIDVLARAAAIAHRARLGGVAGFKREHRAPWTRVNNCTESIGKHGSGADGQGKGSGYGGRASGRAGGRGAGSGAVAYQGDGRAGTVGAGGGAARDSVGAIGAARAH